MATPLRTVYMDHAASTSMHPEALEAMNAVLTGSLANPSGAHRLARDARRAVDEARDLVAELVGCSPGEVVFTSGGTEGANAAVLGAVRRGGGTAVCPAAEHHAVLHCVEHAEGRVLPVRGDGSVDPAELSAALGRAGNVSVVSVMSVNNEVGTVSDLAAVSREVRRAAPGAVLHTDAVQAVTWLDPSTLWPHVDVLTVSAHKFGGPKGCGVMVVREGTTLEPLVLGGGQERDRRSGTHNVAGIVATAAAMAVAHRDREATVARVSALRTRLVDGIVSQVPVATPTVDAAVPGIAHLCLEGLESESILFLLDEQGVCASAASACASGAMEPSHVLAAMGVPARRAGG
ncbi:MAG: cysteine desulfurase family protein, partial [Ilumatobacteraceae bacterium]